MTVFQFEVFTLLKVTYYELAMNLRIGSISAQIAVLGFSAMRYQNADDLAKTK